MWVYGLDWAGPGQRHLADASECGNEPSGSVKCGEFLTSCKPVSCSRRTLHHGVSKNCTVSTKCKVCVDATDSLEYRCYILPLNFLSVIPPLEAKPVKQCILKLTKIKSGGRYIIYNAQCSVVSDLLSSASCAFRVSVISCTGQTYQVNKSYHAC